MKKSINTIIISFLLLMISSCDASQKNVFAEKDYELIKVDSLNNKVGTEYYINKYDSSRKMQIDYDAKGKLLAKSFSHNGKLDGRFEMYNPDGSFMAIDSFKDGVKTYSKDYFVTDTTVKIFKNGKLIPLNSKPL